MICCVLAVSGCSDKKSSKQTNKNDIHDKVGQDIFPLLPTYEPGSVSGESNEVLTNEGDAQQEADIRYELASMLPFTEGDDKICAIAYMGDSGVEHEENLTAFYEKYFPSVESNSWEILPNFDCGGGECYLVIPRYEDTVSYVNMLEKTSEGNIEVVTSRVAEQEAFLVYCNATPEYANAEVNILYGESRLVVVPRLSPVDGRIEPNQVALDLTMEEVYQ